MTNGAAPPPSRRQRAAEWAGNRMSDVGGGIQRAGSGLNTAYARTAENAPKVAKKAGNVVVKIARSAGKLQPRATFWLFLVAAFQLADAFLLDFKLETGTRIAIYTVIFFLTSFGSSGSMSWKKSLAFSAMSVFVPLGWSALSASSFPFRQTLEGFAPIDILNAAAFLLSIPYVIYLALSPSQNPISGILQKALIVFIIWGMVFPQINAIAQNTGLSELTPKFDKGYIQKVATAGIKVSFGEIAKIPAALTKSFQRTIKGATGDFYTGEVDKNVREPLGVTIEKLEPADQEYQEGERVTVWTTMKARTLEEPIRIIPKCWSDREKRGSELQGLILPAEIEVDSFESDIFNCRFESLKAGQRHIKAAATFSFETKAYVKTYFMDKDKLRSLRREQIDPFDFYKITDKSPVAVFTNGPVKIEMSVPDSPIGLKPGELNQPFIGVTLSNNWEGRIESITDFRIELPKGFELAGEDACSHKFKSEGSSEDGYNVYTLDVESARLNDPDKFTDIDKFQRFRCLLKVNDDEIPSVLGGTPISIKYFRASAKYAYSVEKEMSMDIKKKETPDSVPGGAGTGTGTGSGSGEALPDKPINAEDTIAVIKKWAKEYKVPEMLALQVAAKEGSLQHYAVPNQLQTENGVKLGDGGCSIGVMQINTCAHPECRGRITYEPGSANMCRGAFSCANAGAYGVEDLNCNIEAAMKLLRSHYDTGQTNPSAACTCGGKYSGWDYALRRYNGCDCDKPYVEIVNAITVSQYLT